MWQLYWAGIIALVIVAVGATGVNVYIQIRLAAPLISEEDIMERRADAAAQNESAFSQPAPVAAKYPRSSRLRNPYFGDLHGHSDLSFDSYIFGNRLSLDQSYHFAKGEAVKNAIGETMQLTRPLDFAAMTDHAESFGLHEGCRDPDGTPATLDLCERLESPSISLFLDLVREAIQRPPVSAASEAMQDEEKGRRFAKETWDDIVRIADEHNEPGRFTTFAAYEYSPPLPDRGKIHRNVIFRSNQVPAYAVSAFDALTEIDLWKQLDAGCQDPCEFLTILHNPNKSWGLAFASHTIDGDVYTMDDWKRRDKAEPIVEMYQIKGNSECSVGFGTSDEECNFEQFFPRCEGGEETLCIYPTSMARDGLKKGIQMEEELGFNPLDFGMIGSTDTHNSNPGDTEEWDYRGSAGVLTAPARARLVPGDKRRTPLIRNPGGLSVIWAERNTRDALFAAMQRKEVYATSGTRIILRFFGGFNYQDNLPALRGAVRIAYLLGTPMGGTIQSVEGEAPSFFIWAAQDPIDAPLDKVQIVKGWTENGQTREEVIDVICSEGRQADADTNRCPPTTASVSLANCEFESGRGARELKTLWTDTNYRADQNAFYYARVIQNPTCRWSTYDSLRLGETPLEGYPATSTEMAWSSPIWIRNR